MNDSAVRLGGALGSWLLLALVGCGGEEKPPINFDAMMQVFTPTTCKHTLASGSKTRCGYVAVPELRTDPMSRKIKVYAAVFPAMDPAKATTPLIYLTGGPGTSTASAMGLFENDPTYRNTFGDNRDLVVLDQRGTNYSEPSLYCSDELRGSLIPAYGMSLVDATNLRLKKLAECYTRLKASGANLSAYNTNENATDVRDVALALGYPKVNLYGASYGTRLTMTVMKLLPDLVQSAVIDSVLPPEVNSFAAQPEGVAYGLAAFWNQTKTDFPQLESQFYATIERLQNLPIKVTAHHYDTNGNPKDSIDVTVGPVEYISYVVGALRNTPITQALPLQIATMFMNPTRMPGNYQIVADAYLGTIEFLFPIAGPGTEATAYGMFESVGGAGDGSFTSVAQIQNNINHFLQGEAMRQWGQANFIDQNADVVGMWPVTPLPASVQYPLISDIPTLLLVGTLDTATPQPYSEQSSHYLSKNFYRNELAGHAVAYLPCASMMLDEFLKNPSQNPMTMCPKDPMWKKTL